MSRKGKSTDTESRLAVALDWGKRVIRDCIVDRKFPPGAMRMCLHDIVVNVAQPRECAKCH